MNAFLRNVILILCYGIICNGWKAMPANQAIYALRQSGPNNEYVPDEEGRDELMVRDTLNHVYKFGWCTKDATSRQYLLKSVNITLATWQSTQVTYLYILAKKHTINFDLQCVVMKSYVPAKFFLLKSRLPLYYCQGTIFILMLNTINRYEIHEFYFYRSLNMPINFNFEFYKPHLF